MNEVKKIGLLKVEIEKWAKANSLGIFYGDEGTNLTSIEYSGGEEENISDLQKLILQVKPSFIIMLSEGVLLESHYYETQIEWFKENDEKYEAHS